MIIALFLIGLVLGFTVAWFLSKGQIRWRVTEAVTQLESKAKVEESKASALAEQIHRYESELQDLRQELAGERDAKTAALTRFEESIKNIDEQKKLLETMQKKFEDSLEALSVKAVRSSSEEFFGQAQNIVGPLGETLKRYDEQIRELEKNRASAYGSLENQIQSLISTQQLLQKEAGNLASALRTPHIRGKWGESALKRIVELAGMAEHSGFLDQVSMKVEENRIRPDMVLYLSGDRQLVVDSKFPDTSISDYMEAADDNARKISLIKHAQSMRRHMNDLSSKKYWDQFPKAPECVVMFVPLESSVSAALSSDPELLQDAFASKVIIAGPVSFYALLLSYASDWRQERVAKNTQEIAELGKQLYERFATFIGHLNKTRNSLEQSIFNFNRTVSSLEGRVMPSLRKFKDLGATGAEDISSIEPIEQAPRQLEGYEGKDTDPVKDLFSSKK